MKHLKVLLTSAFLFGSAFSYCQVTPSDTSLSIQKEQFRKELSDYLGKKAVYPQACLEKHIWGDVILSCELDRAGKLTAPLIQKSPDPLLTTDAILTMNYLNGKWDTGNTDFYQLEKEYLYIFRYRIYLNVMPVDNKARGMKLFDDAKYEKALKAFDRARDENEYDSDLFSFRAKCKEAIGDMNGAAQDHAKAKKLSNDIMTVIDVIAIGRTSTVRVSRGRIVAIPAEPGHIYP